jgi:hypothetical protein
MASLVEVDRRRRGWRQIDVTPADKGTERLKIGRASVYRVLAS